MRTRNTPNQRRVSCKPSIADGRPRHNRHSTERSTIRKKGLYVLHMRLLLNLCVTCMNINLNLRWESVCCRTLRTLNPRTPHEHFRVHLYVRARAHKPCSSLVHSFTRTQPPTHRFAGQAERVRGSKETSINHLDTGFGRGLAGRKV